MGFPRREYWSGLPLPSPGDLPDPGIQPGLLHFRQILYDWAIREAQKVNKICCAFSLPSLSLFGYILGQTQALTCTSIDGTPWDFIGIILMVNADAAQWLLICYDNLWRSVVSFCSIGNYFINPAHFLLFSYIFIIFVGINSIYFFLFNWFLTAYWKVTNLIFICQCFTKWSYWFSRF